LPWRWRLNARYSDAGSALSCRTRSCPNTAATGRARRDDRDRHCELEKRCFSDDLYVYINDPWHSETDYIDVPVAHEEYQAMARFGRSRLRATLILKAGRVEARTKKPA
jgi:hypothetical protein